MSLDIELADWRAGESSYERGDEPSVHSLRPGDGQWGTVGVIAEDESTDTKPEQPESKRFGDRLDRTKLARHWPMEIDLGTGTEYDKADENRHYVKVVGCRHGPTGFHNMGPSIRLRHSAQIQLKGRRDGDGATLRTRR